MCDGGLGFEVVLFFVEESECVVEVEGFATFGAVGGGDVVDLVEAGGAEDVV